MKLHDKLTEYENFFSYIDHVPYIMIDEVKNTLKIFFSSEKGSGMGDAEKVSQKYYFKAMKE